jgi:uroporphyrinogen decarboxylase
MKTFVPRQWRYNEITPKEGMKALVAGEEIDRILCCPLISEDACRLVGVTVSRYCPSSDLIAKGVIAVFRRYRPDEVAVYRCLHTIAEAMGTKLTFPEDDMRFVNAPFLKPKRYFNILSLQGSFL